MVSYLVSHDHDHRTEHAWLSCDAEHTHFQEGNLAPLLPRYLHGAEPRPFVERIVVRCESRCTLPPCRRVGRDENLDLDVDRIAASDLKCRRMRMTLWYLMGK